MTTTTAVPSSDVGDFVFNVQKLDEIATGSALTYTDRLGQQRSTAAGAMARFAALNPRGAWATATVYQPRDLVLNSGTWYIALDTHTSGATFAGDLTAHWRPEQGVTATDLSNTANVLDGDARIGVLKTFSGAQPSDQHEVNEREYDLYDALTLAQKADYRTQSLALDLTSVLQAALNSGATVVRMRPGKAKVTSKITKPRTVRIQGDGEQSSWIVAAHNGTVMECSHPSLGGDAKAGIFDVGFTTTGGATPAIGLLLANINQTSLERVRFDGGYVIGIQENFCLNSKFDEISLVGCTGQGLYVYSSGLATGNNGNEYSNFNIITCGTGIRYDGTGTLSGRFRNVKVENCTTYPVEVINCTKLVFDGLYLEANSSNIQLSGGNDIIFRDGINVSAQQWINTAGFGATGVVVQDLQDLSSGGIIVNNQVEVRGFGYHRFPGGGVANSSEFALDYFANDVSWTPADSSGAGLSFTLGVCKYTRIGDTVFAFFDITYPVTASGLDNSIGGLPFPSPDASPVLMGFSDIGTNGATHGNTNGGGGSTFQFKTVTRTTPTNANLSGKRFTGTIIYRV